MRSVGLKILKNKLGEYVRLAAAGETVLITNRGRVVAELVPPRAEHRTALADVFRAEGIREGWLRPATNRTGKPPPRKPVVPFNDLMRDLAESRRDR